MNKTKTDEYVCVAASLTANTFMRGGNVSESLDSHVKLAATLYDGSELEKLKDTVTMINRLFRLDPSVCQTNYDRAALALCSSVHRVINSPEESDDNKRKSVLALARLAADYSLSIDQQLSVVHLVADSIARTLGDDPDYKFPVPNKTKPGDHDIHVQSHTSPSPAIGPLLSLEQDYGGYPPRWYTIKKLAEFCSMHRTTVYRALEAKIGEKVNVVPVEVQSGTKIMIMQGPPEHHPSWNIVANYIMGKSVRMGEAEVYNFYNRACLLRDEINKELKKKRGEHKKKK